MTLDDDFIDQKIMIENNYLQDFSDLSQISHKRSLTVDNMINPKFVRELTFNKLDVS